VSAPRVQWSSSALPRPQLIETKPALFLFDEPTTGLHFDDVRVLLRVFQRLVDEGHSVLVIEHNLEVIKCADWIIDLGPDAGDQGGQIVATGTPGEIVQCEESHTGRALREVWGNAESTGRLSGECQAINRSKPEGNECPTFDERLLTSSPPMSYPTMPPLK
jgi:ABC-type glutathione transport system ATPase component